MSLNSTIGNLTTIQNRRKLLGALETTQRFARQPAVATAAVQQVDAAAMQRCDSLKQLLEQCSGVFLDQFGVLHDGRKPYPHAVAAVQCLFEAGKQIIILSNSSRRSTGTIGKLSQMGFKPEWFSGAITSGELTHTSLLTRPTSWWQQLGRRCIHLTWSTRGAISLEGLGLQVTTDPAEADFILAHGTEAVGCSDGSPRDMSLQDLHQLLQQCAEVAQQQGRHMPMIVANPDLVTVDGSDLITMPGTLAKQYQQLGGTVQLMGKPDPLFYAAARELAAQAGFKQQQQHQQQWLAVGDSLEHDIAGGSAAGLQSLFIVGGIHASDVDLRGAPDQTNTNCSWDEAALARLCQQHEVLPTYCMPFLQP